MTISVIIVSWNAKGFLRGCLQSLRQFPPSLLLEIIVVDNASSDGSPEMVTSDFPEVRLIRNHENVGFARANNVGIKMAHGSYLALINSDVLVHLNCLQVLKAFLDKNPSVALIGPKIFGSDGHIQHTCRRFPTIWNTTCRLIAIDRVLWKWPLFSGFEMRHWDYSRGGEVEVLSGCFWLARREAVDSVGGLDERFFFYAEDVDWCRRFSQSGWKVAYVPAATATHFGGGSSSNAPLRYSIEMLKANLAYWRKHRGKSGHYTYFFLCLLHYSIRATLRTIIRLLPFRGSRLMLANLDEDYTCLRWLLTGRRA